MDTFQKVDTAAHADIESIINKYFYDSFLVVDTKESNKLRKMSFAPEMNKYIIVRLQSISYSKHN